MGLYRRLSSDQAQVNELRFTLNLLTVDLSAEKEDARTASQIQMFLKVRTWQSDHATALCILALSCEGCCAKTPVHASLQHLT